MHAGHGPCGPQDQITDMPHPHLITAFILTITPTFKIEYYHKLVQEVLRYNFLTQSSDSEQEIHPEQIQSRNFSDNLVLLFCVL